MDFENLFDQARKHPGAEVSARKADGDTCTVPSAQLLDEAQALADRLAASGVTRGMQIGLQAQNGYEYLLWDLAAIRLGAVLHTLPEDLPADAIAAVVEAQRAALWVFEKAENFDGVGNGVAIADTLSRNEFPVAADAATIAETDLHSRVYSSGSSGRLKGLNISRRGTEGLVSDFIADFALAPADSHLIFLPLSNYQQRLSVYGCLWAGASFKVVHHTAIFQEIGRYAPSFIVAPPAIYEVIYNLFGRGADAAEKLPAFFGGKIRFMITGMAPISRELLVGFNRHGLNLLEAYGVTETGMIAWNTPGQSRIGSVGRPIHPEHVHLTDESEVVIKRPFPLSLGYFDSSSEDSAATFRADGSIATGDMGVIDADGFLSLSGRKKEIIVTSGGSKFHPEEIERALVAIAGVRHAVVTMSAGDGKLVAVLVVDAQTGPDAIVAIEQGIQAMNESVASYKRIHRKVVTTTMLTIENGMLTRNLKYDRRGIYRHFQAQIESGEEVAA